jgi:glutaredoxin
MRKTHRSSMMLLQRCQAALLAACVPLAAALFGLDAWAQFKVIGPDGKVTYSDRAPPPADGKATTLGVRSSAPAPDAALPAELRQPAGRYPATLYTMPNGCRACESARSLLRQRGIPHTEKVVASAEDSDALEQVTGGRDVPVLTLGGQVVRGFASDLWISYLDAAGYPRESRLPANYRHPEPTPLVKPRESVAARTAPAPAAPPPAAEPEAILAPPPAGSIKF